MWQSWDTDQIFWQSCVFYVVGTPFLVSQRGVPLLSNETKEKKRKENTFFDWLRNIWLALRIGKLIEEVMGKKGSVLGRKKQLTCQEFSGPGTVRVRLTSGCFSPAQCQCVQKAPAMPPSLRLLTVIFAPFLHLFLK